MLPLLTSGHQRKASKSHILNLNVVGERQDICYLFLLFPFGHSGSWFLTSSPCGNAKNMLFFTQGVYAGMGVLKQMRFPHDLNLQRASRHKEGKQDIKQGSARPPTPFLQPHSSKKKKSHFIDGKWPEGKSC